MIDPGEARIPRLTSQLGWGGCQGAQLRSKQALLDNSASHGESLESKLFYGTDSSPAGRESRDCSNHVFTSAFWWFDIWNLADFEGTAPPPVSQFLEIENNLPTSTLYRYKSTLQPTPLWGFHSLAHYLPVLPPQDQVPDNAPVPQGLLKLFKAANPSSPCFTLSFSWKPQ